MILVYKDLKGVLINMFNTKTGKKHGYKERRKGNRWNY